MLPSLTDILRGSLGIYSLTRGPTVITRVLSGLTMSIHIRGWTSLPIMRIGVLLCEHSLRVRLYHTLLAYHAQIFPVGAKVEE